MLLNIVMQQQGPADTTSYMLLGFGVIFGTMIIHVWSMYRRAAQYKKDMALLRELEEQE